MPSNWLQRTAPGILLNYRCLDLEGWDIKFTKHLLNENFNNTFRVEDGILVVSYDEWDSLREEFGHIFYREPFSWLSLVVGFFL